MKYYKETIVITLISLSSVGCSSNQFGFSKAVEPIVQRDLAGTNDPVDPPSPPDNPSTDSHEEESCSAGWKTVIENGILALSAGSSESPAEPSGIELINSLHDYRLILKEKAGRSYYLRSKSVDVEQHALGRSLDLEFRLMKDEVKDGYYDLKFSLKSESGMGGLVHYELPELVVASKKNVQINDSLQFLKSLGIERFELQKRCDL